MSTENTNLGLSLDDLGEDKVRLVPKEGGNKVKIVKIGMTQVTDKVTQQPIEAFEIIFIDKETGGEFIHRVLKPRYIEDARTDDERKMVGWQINSLRHIAHGLLPKDGELPKGLYWKKGMKFAELVKAVFANSIPDEEIKTLGVKIKAVYGKGTSYVQLPLFAPFFSTVNRPLEFAYDPNYDFLTPQSKQPQSEGGANNSSAASTNFSDWD